VILTPSQMKSIADKGRALPDEILAPLVLDIVLGSSTGEAPRAAEPRTYAKLSDRIDALVAFLAANPESPMRHIAPALGIAKSHACLVVRQAVKSGRVKSRGSFGHTRYHVPQTKEALAVDVAERKRGPGRVRAPQKRVDAAVVYVRTHPGCQMHDIVSGIGASRTSAQVAVARAAQDGLVERRGQRADSRYYPTLDAVDAQPPPSMPADPKPAVLLTEQHIDGENRQRLVQVVRRRPAEPTTPPSTPEHRAAAISTFVRRNPGTRRADIIKVLRCDLNHFREAILIAKASGDIRATGERNGTRYYPRGYVNGATAQQPGTVPS